MAFIAPDWLLYISVFFFAIESKSYLYLNDDANISHITNFDIDIQLMIVLVSYCTCCASVPLPLGNNTNKQQL